LSRPPRRKEEAASGGGTNMKMRSRQQMRKIGFSILISIFIRNLKRKIGSGLKYGSSCWTWMYYLEAVRSGLGPKVYIRPVIWGLLLEMLLALY